MGPNSSRGSNSSKYGILILGFVFCTFFLCDFDLGFGRNWTRQSLLLQILPLLLPFLPLLLLQWEVLPIPLLSLRNFQRRYIDVLEPWFNYQRCRWHTDLLEPWLETLVEISCWCCDKIKIQIFVCCYTMQCPTFSKEILLNCGWPSSLILALISAAILAVAVEVCTRSTSLLLFYLVTKPSTKCNLFLVFLLCTFLALPAFQYWWMPALFYTNLQLTQSSTVVNC